jgi:CBS domain-containing protein
MSVKALAEIVERAADQDLFPVIDGSGVLCGVVAAEALRIVASHPELHGLAVVADMMEPPASVGIDQDLRAAAELMVARDLRSVPITDSTGTIVGLLDEHDIAATVLGGGARRSP